MKSLLKWLFAMAVSCALPLAAQDLNNNEAGGTEESRLTAKKLQEIKANQKRVDYSVGPQDLLNISVLGVEQLKVEGVPVSATGTIDYWFFEDLKVEGNTLTQVSKKLEELLEKDYIIDPQVMVTIHEYSARTVAVMGAVNKPGLVKLPAEKPMDILEALAEAGGLNEKASTRRIELTRDGKTEQFSVRELQRARGEEKVWLRPGDTIIVKESFL